MPARLLRGLGVALAGVGFTLGFVLLAFPYDRYRGAIEAGLGDAIGAPVRIGHLAPALGRIGASLGFRDLTVALPDRDPVAIDELRVRPAFARSWIRLDPAWRVWAASGLGHADGILWLGERAAFRGTLQQVELEALNLDTVSDGLLLRGRADVAADVLRTERGLEGRVGIRAHDGSIALPPYGLPVPFASAQGEFELDPQDGIRVISFTLEDRALTVTASGSVGIRPNLERGRLALTARFEVRDPGMRGLLAALVPIDPHGRADVRVTGSLASPTLR